MGDLILHIRAARRADVPGVDALLARSYPRLLKADYPPSVLVTAVPLISRAQPGLVASGTYYVAETDAGQIVGAGGWTRRDPATARTVAGQGNIRHFATDPAFTRKGIGGALLERCLRDAQDSGLVAMTCYSTRTAVPFYAAHGFEAEAEVEIELRPGVLFPAIRMQRDL